MLNSILQKNAKKHVRKTNFAMTYTKELLQQAINEVKRGRPLASVAKEFSIPRTTIRNNLNKSEIGNWEKKLFF